jgi:Mor family transcriptional regulator
MSQAVHLVLVQLYRGLIEADAPVNDVIPEKEQRNQQIFTRYMAGERTVELAREFGISVRRANQLIRRYINRGQMEG